MKEDSDRDKKSYAIIPIYHSSSTSILVNRRTQVITPTESAMVDILVDRLAKKGGNAADLATKLRGFTPEEYNAAINKNNGN